MEKFETTKLYFGFPVVILGYEDSNWGHNITTISSSYTLKDTLVIGIYKKGNAVKQIMETNRFSINIPDKRLEKQFIEAGSSSGTDKLKSTGLKHIIQKDYNVPILTDCMLSMVCEVQKMEEYGNFVHIIADIKERYLSQKFIKDNKMDVSGFNPVYFMGDEHERFYRYLNEEVVPDKR